jgi:uncharacterized protein (TIGR02246 family)
VTGDHEDALAIRLLLEAYADAVFRRDPEAWGGTWAENGVWSVLGAEFSGREAIVAAWRQAMAGFPVAAFFCQPGVIRIDGDRASGRSYTHEVLKTADGGVRRVVGAYDDVFVRRAGRWRFAARRFNILLEH